ncbi:conserved hypothetical protein [metagenome]|uniref:FAD-dependent urate hydroxylase HpyO/Asp monooxygenase CreE-like FAD/NAD(P)-binding domain-containing protein n=1 Tax=metagenome TaxID=256318 RepID=A0A2P2C2I0_9ZZZZ
MTRLAVVGGGPRAVWALERLASRMGRTRLPGPYVDVYTPRGRVGASEHYDPALPAYLRLNVAASVIDAGHGSAGEERSLPSFDAWRRAEGSAGELDPFPPRALAGAYLDEMADRVLAQHGDRVRVLPQKVARVCEHPLGGWLVGTAAGQEEYDDVLLVTGHAHSWSGRSAGSVPAYPISSMTAQVPDRHPVVVRGAALTAIDVVLALTEGRGGRFVDDAYRASGREPRITLVSRTGRLMLPKTGPDVLAGRGATPERAHAVAAAHLADDDWPGALVAVGESLVPDARWPQVRRAGPGVLEPEHDDARERLADDLAIARGQAAPDARWAFGQAWRLLYAGLVAAQDRDLGSRPDGPTLGWAGYAAWASAAERLAFGPPPVNAAKLLTLLDAGVVEVVAGDVDSVATERGAEIMVDAVIAPPGLRGVGDAPWPELLRSGAVSLARHGRGIRVTASGACLGRDGRTTPGLWAFGRVAEDSVIGHDTLIRGLHPGPDLWAEQLLAGQRV